MASAGGMNAAPTANCLRWSVLRQPQDLSVTDYVGDSSPGRGAKAAAHML